MPVNSAKSACTSVCVCALWTSNRYISAVIYPPSNYFATVIERSAIAISTVNSLPNRQGKDAPAPWYYGDPLRTDRDQLPAKYRLIFHHRNLACDDLRLLVGREIISREKERDLIPARRARTYRPTRATLAPLAINLMNSVWLFRAPNSHFTDGQPPFAPFPTRVLTVSWPYLTRNEFKLIRLIRVRMNGNLF